MCWARGWEAPEELLRSGWGESAALTDPIARPLRNEGCHSFGWLEDHLIARNLLIAALLLVGTTGVASANDYISENPNDWFRFTNKQTGQDTRAEIQNDLGGWRLWSQFGGLGSTWVYTTDSHDWFWLWNGQTYTLINNLSGNVGQSRTIDMGPCLSGASATITNRGSLTTPVGTFNDCTELRFTGGNCADAGTTSIWFAKGVGVVQWSEQSFMGEQTWELTGAQVDGRNYTNQPATPTTPSLPTTRRAPAEHEQMEAILWGANDTYLVMDTYTDAFPALNGTGVICDVNVSSQSVASQLRFELVQNNVPMDDVEIYVAALDSVWMRDYGPIVLKDGNGNRTVSDPEYYPGRPNDDDFPVAYANARNWPVVDVRVGFEGGNYATDGRTLNMCSTGVQRFNPSMSKTRIETEFEKFGYTRTEWFTPLINEGTTHVDMFMRIMNDTHALVSRYPSSHRQHAVTNQAASKLQALGYQVVRVDVDHAYDEFATYSNSVLANGIALVPQYSNATKNRAALAAYRSLGYQAVGIDSTLIIKYSGATHCLSMQVPAGN